MGEKLLSLRLSSFFLFSCLIPLSYTIVLYHCLSILPQMLVVLLHCLVILSCYTPFAPNLHISSTSPLAILYALDDFSNV